MFAFTCKSSSESPEVIPAEPSRSSGARAGGAATQRGPHAPRPSPGAGASWGSPGTQRASGFPGETVWTADSMLGLTETNRGRGEGFTGRLPLLALQ